MKDNEIASKKDIILLTGDAGLRIDRIAKVLLKYFDHHIYVSQDDLYRSILTLDEGIAWAIHKDRKLIIHAPQGIDSNEIFQVDIVFRHSHCPKPDYAIDLYLGLDNEEIAQQIIVAWGCWIDNRPITKPIH